MSGLLFGEWLAFLNIALGRGQVPVKSQVPIELCACSPAKYSRCQSKAQPCQSAVWWELSLSPEAPGGTIEKHGSDGSNHGYMLPLPRGTPYGAAQICTSELGKLAWEWRFHTPSPFLGRSTLSPPSVHLVPPLSCLPLPYQTPALAELSWCRSSLPGVLGSIPGSAWLPTPAQHLPCKSHVPAKWRVRITLLVTIKWLGDSAKNFIEKVSLEELQAKWGFGLRSPWSKSSVLTTTSCRKDNHSPCDTFVFVGFNMEVLCFHARFLTICLHTAIWGVFWKRSSHCPTSNKMI